MAKQVRKKASKGGMKIVQKRNEAARNPVVRQPRKVPARLLQEYRQTPLPNYAVREWVDKETERRFFISDAWAIYRLSCKKNSSGEFNWYGPIHGGDRPGGDHAHLGGRNVL